MILLALVLQKLIMTIMILREELNMNPTIQLMRALALIFKGEIVMAMELMLRP